MLPSIEVHSQRHFAVGLKRRERDLTKPRPTVRNQNLETHGKDDSFLKLFSRSSWSRSSSIPGAILEPCEAYQNHAENWPGSKERGTLRKRCRRETILGGSLADSCLIGAPVQFMGRPTPAGAVPSPNNLHPSTPTIPHSPGRSPVAFLQSPPFYSLHTQCRCIGIVMAWKLFKNQPCSQGCGPDSGCRPVYHPCCRIEKQCRARFWDFGMHTLSHGSQHAIFRRHISLHRPCFYDLVAPGMTSQWARPSLC